MQLQDYFNHFLLKFGVPTILQSFIMFLHSQLISSYNNVIYSFYPHLLVGLWVFLHGVFRCERGYFNYYFTYSPLIHCILHY